MDRSAEPDLAGAMVAQWRTDELRELLERYPAINRAETRRVRQLLGEASATEIFAISSSEELARKARSLEAIDPSTLEVIAIVIGITLACVLLYLVLGPP